MTSLSETSMLAGSSGVSTGYTIDQSIRFNQDDSAYLTKTFGGSASNRRTHTYSFWVKLGAKAAGSNSSGGVHFISTNDSGANAGDYLHLNGDLELRYWSNESSASTFETNQLFRDFSAWYHIVLVNDRDHSVGEESVRLYVNGERVTSFSVDNITARKGQDTMVNASSFLWMIGRQTSLTVHSDCYMAEIHFVDGYAYGPEYFGEFKEDTDIWIPKEYDGSYGTNGFKIDGRDSGDLGDDESGNGNDFGSSGLASNDQKADTPTNNHCVWNPLRNTGSTTMSDGNLTVTTSGGTYKSILGTIGIPPNSGIFYYEGVINSHTIQCSLGWGSSDMGVNQNNNPAEPKYFMYSDYNGKYYSSGGDGAVGDGFTNTDVIGLWIDTDSTSSNLKFYRNGTLQSTHSFDFSDVAHIMPLTQHLNGCGITGRFAADEWTQTPSGVTASNAITTNNIGS